MLIPEAATDAHAHTLFNLFSYSFFDAIFQRAAPSINTRWDEAHCSAGYGRARRRQQGVGTIIPALLILKPLSNPGSDGETHPHRKIYPQSVSTCAPEDPRTPYDPSLR